MKQSVKFLFAWILSFTLSAASVQNLPVFAEEVNEMQETVIHEDENQESGTNKESVSDSQDTGGVTEISEQDHVPEEGKTAPETPVPETELNASNVAEDFNHIAESEETHETSEGEKDAVSEYFSIVNGPNQVFAERLEEKGTEENKATRNESVPSAPSSNVAGSSVSYEDVSDTAESLRGNLAFVIHVTDGDYTFGVQRAAVSVSEAEFDAEGKLSVTSQNYILAEEDHPGMLAVPSFRNTYYLYAAEGALAVSTNMEETEGAWGYQNHHLFYEKDSGIWYVSGIENGSIALSSDSSQACELSLYSGDKAPERPTPAPRPAEDTRAPQVIAQPEIRSFVREGSFYEAPYYSVQFKRPDLVETDRIQVQWNVRGEPYGEMQELFFDEEGKAYSSVTVDALRNQPYGVYPVNCTAVITEADGTSHSMTSYTSNFIVTRGVLANSVLTFSDLHNSFDHVGQAILDTMNSHDGLIPSLIIATGDFHSSQYAGYNQENIEKAAETLVHRAEMQMGGIDAVWVAGNHDNGYAAAYANLSAGLGVSAVYMNPEEGMSGTGIIFDTRSRDYHANADTSRNMDQGLIVIGINYEDLGSQGAYGPDGGRAADESKLSYGEEGSEHTVYAYLKQALDHVAADYHGEPVIISAHAGLHAVGIDPSSSEAGGKEWGGTGTYNLNLSNAAVHLINDYASRYQMDILFLFGHDHSRQEVEFLKLPGDTIISTVSYDQKTTEEIQLNFTYGHSGYITDTIGGSQRYSLILTDDTVIQRQLKTVGTSDMLIDGVSASIERHVHHPEPEPSPDPEPDPMPRPIPFPDPFPSPSVKPYFNPMPADRAGKASLDEDTAGSAAVSGYVPVTCQMAGYTIDYAWNEEARACQPGYIDDLGRFHAYGSDRGRYYIPDTADR